MFRAYVLAIRAYLQSPSDQGREDVVYRVHDAAHSMFAGGRFPSWYSLEECRACVLQVLSRLRSGDHKIWIPLLVCVERLFPDISRSLWELARPPEPPAG